MNFSDRIGKQLDDMLGGAKYPSQTNGADATEGELEAVEMPPFTQEVAREFVHNALHNRDYEPARDVATAKWLRAYCDFAQATMLVSTPSIAARAFAAMAATMIALICDAAVKPAITATTADGEITALTADMNSLLTGMVLDMLMESQKLAARRASGEPCDCPKCKAKRGET